MEFDESYEKYEDNYEKNNLDIEKDISDDKNIDLELEELINKQKTRMKVIGCGGGGNNTINRISEVGVDGIGSIAINTDAQDLLYTVAGKKILIGRELTKGRGAGSNPKMGQQSAKESQVEIKRSIENSDIVFITCGLGGGTGSGSAPVVAEIAKSMGALTVAIVTMPFSMEGAKRKENAYEALDKLEEIVDTLIIIPNDKLLLLAQDLPLQTAFKVADEILTNAIKGIAELVTKTGLVNLDFADISAIMGNGGISLIGMGESDSTDRANEAVRKAIENPLLGVDIKGAQGALINVMGGETLTLDEAKRVIETVSEHLAPNAKIIWGAQISKDLDNLLKVMIIVTGIKSNQVGIEDRDDKIKKIEKDLGIEFVN